MTMSTYRRKDTKRAATSRKHSGIRRPQDDRRYQPNLLRGVLEDIETHVEIREASRTEYAQEFAEDIGAVEKDSSGGWPGFYIDWEAAAEALQQDYTVVEFRGSTYYVR
jgi:antirestriction protein